MAKSLSARPISNDSCKRQHSNKISCIKGNERINSKMNPGGLNMDGGAVLRKSNTLFLNQQ
jgi:hypothetical protein